MNEVIRYRYPIVLWSVEVIQLDQDVALAADLRRTEVLAGTGSARGWGGLLLLYS